MKDVKKSVADLGKILTSSRRHNEIWNVINFHFVPQTLRTGQQNMNKYRKSDAKIT